MNKKKLKITGYFVLAILLLNIILFAFTIIHWMVFWTVIVLGAIFVYKVLPKLKK